MAAADIFMFFYLFFLLRYGHESLFRVQIITGECTKDIQYLFNQAYLNQLTCSCHCLLITYVFYLFFSLILVAWIQTKLN